MSDQDWQCRPMVEHLPDIYKILFQSSVPQKAERRRKRKEEDKKKGRKRERREREPAPKWFA